MINGEKIVFKKRFYVAVILSQKLNFFFVKLGCAILFHDT